MCLLQTRRASFAKFAAKLLRESCYSRGIFWHSALEEGQVFAVLIVQPLDLEVEVHVIRTLAQTIFFML